MRNLIFVFLVYFAASTFADTNTRAGTGAVDEAVTVAETVADAAVDAGAVVDAGAEDPALMACLQAVNSGRYRGGRQQSFCEHMYLLPSPLLVRCVNAMDVSGKVLDLSLRAMCEVYCEIKPYLGPWADYPASAEFLARVRWVAELSMQGRCREL